MMEKVMEEHLNPTTLVTRHVESNLKERGVRLSRTRQKQLRAAIERGVESGEITLDFTDREMARATLSDDERARGRLNLTLDVDEVLHQVEELVPSIMNEAVDEVARLLTKVVLRDAQKNLRAIRRQREGFEKRLLRRWGKSLNLFEVLRGVALEAGSELNDDVKQDSDFLQYALVRLHARAIQISSEIEALLRSGHADGAHARWRTLHEVTVVAMFLAHHGIDVAERYIKHDAVESKRVARGYQERQVELGLKPVTVREMATLERMVNALAKQYGQSYLEEYGWAADTLGKAKPRFADIERAVDLDYMRPYYKLASHNIHAGPKGALFRLGLTGSDLLLAGPSNAGLADPLVGAGNSVVQVTVTLLTTRPNFDRLAACRVLISINEYLTDAAMAAHQKLAADEALGRQEFAQDGPRRTN